MHPPPCKLAIHPPASATPLSIRLAQVLEKVLKVGIIDARNRCWTDGNGYISVLLLKRREDFAYLCNDLLHSGIRLLEMEHQRQMISLI